MTQQVDVSTSRGNTVKGRADRLVEIALPVAVEKSFTYLLPPDLQSEAAVGVRVIVPFGRKYATGLIIGFPDFPPPIPLKPVSDIIDAKPVIPEEVLRLCIWISEYYFAPLGEVLKSALPHAFAGASRRLVRLSRSFAEEDTLESGRPSAKRVRLLDLLREHGPMSTIELRKETGLKNINAVVNDLMRQGYVETEEVLPRRKSRPKSVSYVLLRDIDNARLVTTQEALSSRKKRARALLASIQQLTLQGIDEIAASDLLKRSGATSGILREYAASGLVPLIRREVGLHQDYGIEEQTKNITLNADQQMALEAISAALDSRSHKTFLLHGVTGSGKTQVYIEAIRRCLSHDRTAIVLVPEISLTPQIVRRFRSHFGDRVAVVHSRMPAGERHHIWRLANEGSIKVVIGPRSAVFAPLHTIGLIVVDEEHETSYKQFDAMPRYHARDVAIVRGSRTDAVLVLGSATPSVESYSNAISGKYELLSMPRRVDNVPMPDIAIVDMTDERRREYEAMKEGLPENQRRMLKEFRQSSISSVLKEKISDRLVKKEGIILLQNRRGFAPFVECMDCGYTETCDRCNVTMTYHLAKKHLRCHYCGTTRSPRTQCPQCNGVNIELRGIGTQKVEQELAALFPDANVLRMDVDTTVRKGSHERILAKFGEGEADILLGTQMVAKGLDFARVTLVGVISADTQMLLPDFRASERTFQLLTQVAGRAGRSTLHGEVIIQTHQPQHYTLQHVVDHDFASFYTEELQERKELDYPPFSRLVLIEMKGKNEGSVRQESERFARFLHGRNGAFTILGPSPAVISKVNNQYRWHIIIKNLKAHDPAGSHMRSALRTALDTYKRQAKRAVRIIVDVDPVGLM